MYEGLTLEQNEFYTRKETDQVNHHLRLAAELRAIGGDIAPVRELKTQLDQALIERGEIIAEQAGLKSSVKDYQKQQELLAARLVGCEAKLRRLAVEIPEAVKACQVSEFVNFREGRQGLVSEAMAETDREIVSLLLQVRELAELRLSQAQNLRTISEEHARISQLCLGEEGVFLAAPYQEALPWLHRKMPADIRLLVGAYADQVCNVARHSPMPGAGEDLLAWVGRRV